MMLWSLPLTLILLVCVIVPSVGMARPEVRTGLRVSLEVSPSEFCAQSATLEQFALKWPQIKQLKDVAAIWISPNY